MIGVTDTPFGPAERRYTEHLDNPGVCMVCGNHAGRHRTDGTCLVTADSLTDQQVLAWWRSGGHGGSFRDALDASPEMRSRVRRADVPYPEPRREDVERSRRQIADALNAAA